jgi:hypothetical protein
VNAGYPLTDYSLAPERFPDTVRDPRAKLFLLHPKDTAGLQALRQLYPRGVLQRYGSRVKTRDFLLFFVAPQAAGS